MGIFCADKKFKQFEEVSPDFLKEAGVKLLLCDLDNTLRLHSEKEPADELAEWIEKCRKAGVKIVIVSNNGRKKMMKKFCEPLGVPCVWWARKPMSTKLTETMTKYGVKPDEAAMLGDKWSTDVLAAKFAKIKAYKVEHRRDIV